RSPVPRRRAGRLGGPRTAAIRHLRRIRSRLAAPADGDGGEGADQAMTPPAVRYCEDVTRRRARNFWYGIRLLPGPKREALAAVYAMARRIDDVGDGDLPTPTKVAALDRIEASLDRLRPDSRDPILAALGLAVERFP